MSSPSISSFVSVVGLLAALLLLLLLPEQKLGVVFLEQGKASQALAYLDKALEFNPEHEQALLNSAILLQELGRADLRKIARERLLKLLSIDGKFAHKFPTPPPPPPPESIDDDDCIFGCCCRSFVVHFTWLTIQSPHTRRMNACNLRPNCSS